MSSTAEIVHMDATEDIVDNDYAKSRKIVTTDRTAQRQQAFGVI